MAIMSSVAITVQYRVRFKEIATHRKMFMKPMLEQWIDAGCPLIEKDPKLEMFT